MQPTIAEVAAALGKELHPPDRAELEELATALLQLSILRGQSAQLGLLLCRLSLDSHAGGGDDDHCDAAAA